MAKMKKVLALVLALALVLSVATTSVSAFGLTSKDGDSTSFLGKIVDALTPDKAPALPAVSDVIKNIKTSLDGTGLIYDRDYKVEVDVDDAAAGYRVHLIQPTTGKTLYDNYLYYDATTNKFVWDKNWALPEIPTEIPSINDVVNNIYQAAWDSGIYAKADLDVKVTREANTGYKILIINPLTGNVIFNDVVKYTDLKTFEKNFYFETDPDSVLTAHFDDVLPKEEVTEPTEPTTEQEVVNDVTPEAPVVVADAVPMAAADSIANTGDAGVAAGVALTVVAGAAFVAARKKH